MTLRLKLPGNAGEWDSELLIPPKVENAILRITLRLELKGHDGQSFLLPKRDNDGKRVSGETTTIETRPWTEPEWALFRERVKALCEQHWNDEFWLQPPGDYSELDVPFSPLNRLMPCVFRTTPTHRPNIKCEFRLQLVPGAEPGMAHRTITILRLDDGQSGIRHSARLWDHAVVDWRQIISGGQHHRQLPVVHEVGHLLRLLHPGVDVVPGCTRQNNSQSECYCVDGWCGELLGAGMQMTDRLAWPWQKSVQDHTGIEAKRWRVLRVPRLPKLVALINMSGKGTVNLGIAGQAFAG